MISLRELDLLFQDQRDQLLPSQLGVRPLHPAVSHLWRHEAYLKKNTINLNSIGSFLVQNLWFKNEWKKHLCFVRNPTEDSCGFVFIFPLNNRGPLLLERIKGSYRLKPEMMRKQSIQDRCEQRETLAPREHKATCSVT